MKSSVAKRPPASLARADSRSAIFLSPGATYHSDRCEPLMRAVQRGEVQLSALARRGYPGRALRSGVLPEVSTVGVWNAVGPQTWGLDWHRNEGIEFTYLSRGRTAFLVENNRFELKSGQFTITRPWQKHKLGDPAIGPSRLHWFILDVGVRRPNQPWEWPSWLLLSPSDRKRLSMLLRHHEHPVWAASREISASFERIAQLVAEARPGHVQSRLQICFNEILLAVLELLRRKELRLDPRLVSSERTIELFLGALPEHLDHPWSLAEMAEHCGLGRTRFATCCRRITNLPPMKYLARCRVEAARKLLLTEPHLSITEVAFRCGFQTSQYFATTFRQFTGHSPRQYRQE